MKNPHEIPALAELINDSLTSRETLVERAYARGFADAEELLAQAPEPAPESAPQPESILVPEVIPESATLVQVSADGVQTTEVHPDAQG